MCFLCVQNESILARPLVGERAFRSRFAADHQRRSLSSRSQNTAAQTLSVCFLSPAFVRVNVLRPASVVTLWQRCLKPRPVGYTRPLERLISHSSLRRDTLLTASHGFGSEGESRSPRLSLAVFLEMSPLYNIWSTFSVREGGRGLPELLRGQRRIWHFHFLSATRIATHFDFEITVGILWFLLTTTTIFYSS